MVTGAVASIIYGEPRLTNDIDLVININPDEVESFSICQIVFQNGLFALQSLWAFDTFNQLIRDIRAFK